MCRHLRDTRKAEPKKNESQLNLVNLGLPFGSNKPVIPPTQPKQSCYQDQLNQVNLGLSVDSGKLVQPPTQQKQSCYQDQQYPPRQSLYPGICKENIGVPQNMLKHPQEIQHRKHVDDPRLVSSHRRDGSFFANHHSHMEPLRSVSHCPPMAPSWNHHLPMTSWGHPLSSSSGGYNHKQVCIQYARGRCNFGENCKFLHHFR